MAAFDISREELTMADQPKRKPPARKPSACDACGKTGLKLRKNADGWRLCYSCFHKKKAD